METKIRYGTEVTFIVDARLHVTTRVEYGQEVEVTKINILPHQDPIREVWQGPAFETGHVTTVTCSLHGDDPDQFIADARALGMKVEVTRLRGAMGVPEVEVTGAAGALVKFMGDRYVQDEEAAVEWVTDTIVARAAKFLNENTWPILAGLPDDIVWEG